MTTPKLFAAGLTAAALALGGAAAAQPQPVALQSAAPQPPRNGPCFFVSQWKGWKAPTADVLYLRVNTTDVYRVDLSVGSQQLKWPSSHLVSEVRGSSSICSPLDLDLAVSYGHGFRQPLIARTLYKLTPQEVAAIPRKDLP